MKHTNIQTVRMDNDFGAETGRLCGHQGNEHFRDRRCLCKIPETALCFVNLRSSKEACVWSEIRKSQGIREVREGRLGGKHTSFLVF